MMNPLTYCVRCKRFFTPSNNQQVICENCTNDLESKWVLYWWVSFAVIVSVILMYMLFK